MNFDVVAANVRRELGQISEAQEQALRLRLAKLKEQQDEWYELARLLDLALAGYDVVLPSGGTHRVAMLAVGVETASRRHRARRLDDLQAALAKNCIPNPIDVAAMCERAGDREWAQKFRAIAPLAGPNAAKGHPMLQVAARVTKIDEVRDYLKLLAEYGAERSKRTE
jgi:hypothetical protein